MVHVEGVNSFLSRCCTWPKCYYCYAKKHFSPIYTALVPRQLFSTFTWQYFSRMGLSFHLRSPIRSSGLWTWSRSCRRRRRPSRCSSDSRSRRKSLAKIRPLSSCFQLYQVQSIQALRVLNPSHIIHTYQENMNNWRYWPIYWPKKY